MSGDLRDLNVNLLLLLCKWTQYHLRLFKVDQCRSQTSAEKFLWVADGNEQRQSQLVKREWVSMACSARTATSTSHLIPKAQGQSQTMGWKVSESEASRELKKNILFVHIWTAALVNSSQLTLSPQGMKKKKLVSTPALKGKGLPSFPY